MKNYNWYIIDMSHHLYIHYPFKTKDTFPVDLRWPKAKESTKATTAASPPTYSAASELEKAVTSEFVICITKT